MQKLLRENHKILLINCIYKINKYKILLLIIIEVISLNIIFYINFCFMKKKLHDDYIWILKILKRFYDHFNLLYFKIISFDNNKTLILTFFKIFENIVKYALYI